MAKARTMPDIAHENESGIGWALARLGQYRNLYEASGWGQAYRVAIIRSAYSVYGVTMLQICNS